MKIKTEYKLLLGGSILSLIIIYLTKIDRTPAAAEWIYDVGQYFWFNLAIAYLGSIIFYLIVVFVPERRKRKIFLFQIGADVLMVHSKAWRLFFYLRNAANMQEELADTGKMTPEHIKKMLAIVNLDTLHTFIHEHGAPRQSFRDYLEKFKIEINASINNTLAIPYEDSELSFLLLSLQRTSIITGEWIERGGNKIGGLDILNFYIHLTQLNDYFKKHFASEIFQGK